MRNDQPQPIPDDFITKWKKRCKDGTKDSRSRAVMRMRVPLQWTEPHREVCLEDQAEAVAHAHAESLRQGGLLVAFWRVVWHEGVAIIVVHHRGRRRRPVLTKAFALKVQQAKTPLLISEVA